VNGTETKTLHYNNSDAEMHTKSACHGRDWRIGRIPDGQLSDGTTTFVAKGRHKFVAAFVAAAAALSVTGAALSTPWKAEATVSAPIDSTAVNWQTSNGYLHAGDVYTVYTDSPGPDGQAGTWTVDYRSFPYVGPNGYNRATDARIYQGCKVDPTLPYGRLLGRIGEHGRVFSVGAGGTFVAHATSPLYMRINDQGRCVQDNRGYIEVEIGL
jgi:hypothetical protein